VNEQDKPGEEIVITDHNHPVTMVPVRDTGLRPFTGRSRGVIHASREDLLAPVGQDWEVDGDL
jgi:antitoxin (DNA-binding transcriptional repressor) of toxin-antitoxin stability system